MYYQEERKRITIIRWMIVGIGVLIIFLGIRTLSAEAEGTLISPLADLETTPKLSLQNPFSHKQPRNHDEFIASLKEFIADKNGVFSIYYYDLNKNTSFGINETTIFTAASVNKLPILATLYHDASSGKLDLDRRITLQAKDIQDFGTGVLRYEGAGGSYSLKTLAQLLMEKSDNTAAYVLTQILGENHIQDMVEEWGLTQTNINMNKTSSKDITTLLIKMYRGQITDSAHTQEMIGFMDDSDFENRLPALLPKDVKVYHKIGNEVGNIHDVGIIVHPTHPYVLAIMTNDVTNDAAAEEAIAQISKLTFDYVSTQ